MKKLVVLILVVAAGYFAYQKLIVGGNSEEQKQVQTLAGEFSAAKQRFAQAERSAGVNGMDMTGDVDGVMRTVDVLLEKLKDLKAGLKEEKALQKADELEMEMKAFLDRE